jgi:hypothetical protein
VGIFSSVRVVFLTALLFGCLVSPAAADPIALDRGLDAVESAVGSVAELPGKLPPPVPEPPAASPQRPEVGAVEPEIVREPLPPPPAPRAPGSVEPPSGVSDPVAGTAAGTDPGNAPPAPAPVGAGPDRSAKPAPGLGTAGPAPGSIRPAMPAPRRELLAYVWPAIALGPVGDALMTRVAALAPALLLRSLTAPASLSPSGAGAPASDGPGTAAPTAPAASPDPSPFFTPHSGGMSFLVTVITILAALVGMVALARLTVGEDFFSRRWLR